jgi:hypothetical protein
MMSIEGDAKNKKVNRGVILIHPSSVWASSPPGKLVIILMSSTSSRCNTVLIWGSRPFSPRSSLNSTQAIRVSEKIVPLSKAMDSQAPGQRMDGEMEINDSENLQKMFIRLCALNSTVSYALETLGQHRTLIGQLHDEVDALRSQNEDLQRRLEQREETRAQQSSTDNA